MENFQKLTFKIFKKRKVALVSIFRSLLLFPMESFLATLKVVVEEQVKKTIEDQVMRAVRAKLVEFAAKLSEDGKISAESIMECWDKLNPNVVLSDVPKKATPRLKTTKDVKCDVKKKSGANAGDPCGRNCIVGLNTCSLHTPKELKSQLTGAQVSEAAAHVHGPVAGEVEMKDAEVKPASTTCDHDLLVGINKGSKCKLAHVAGSKYCKKHTEMHAKK